MQWQTRRLGLENFVSECSPAASAESISYALPVVSSMIPNFQQDLTPWQFGQSIVGHHSASWPAPNLMTPPQLAHHSKVCLPCVLSSKQPFTSDVITTASHYPQKPALMHAGQAEIGSAPRCSARYVVSLALQSGKYHEDQYIDQRVLPMPNSHVAQLQAMPAVQTMASEQNELRDHQRQTLVTRSHKRKAFELANVSANPDFCFHSQAVLDCFHRSDQQSCGPYDSQAQTMQNMKIENSRRPAAVCKTTIGKHHGKMAEAERTGSSQCLQTSIDQTSAPVTPPRKIHRIIRAKTCETPTLQPHRPVSAQLTVPTVPIQLPRSDQPLVNGLYTRDSISVWAKYMKCGPSTVELARSFCRRINLKIPSRETRQVLWHVTVTIVCCLWIASKLLEKRMELLTISHLIRMVQSTTQSQIDLRNHIFISFEISLMQKLDWQPLKDHMQLLQDG